MNIKYAFLFYMLLFCNFVLHGQIVINEVCSFNGNIIQDENQKEYDWIELYNAGNQDVSLSNYTITNCKSEEWVFPNVQIQAKGFLFLYASGKNRKTNILHTSFNLSKAGGRIQLFDNQKHLINELCFPKQQLNHSFGRFPDASDTIRIFNKPTPDSTNNFSKSFVSYAENPSFSIESGFYNSSKILELTTNSSELSVFYTIDGSIPDSNSNKYTLPVYLDSTKVIKAIALSKDTSVLPSDVVSNTYFINYKSSLAVFSISTNPDNLWDWNHGIFLKGPNADSIYPYYGANFWQDWEVPVHVEFYENNQQLIFEQDAGLSVNGGSVSRTRPMQSLRITARNMYGDNDLSYRFFEDKTIKNFKNIVLRNSSLDFNITHFRDGCLHKLMLNKLNIDLLSYRPAVVFLNGKYWGIQNIRERFSKHYVEENYHFDEDSLDLLEEDTVIIEGNFDDFIQMHHFITSNDMSLKSNYMEAENMIDIESLCDYFIAETFLTNTDWPYNNIKYWKSKSKNSKWRYMLMDLDVSLGIFGWAPAQFDLLGKILSSYGDTNKHVQILKSFLQNPDFKMYFINRYADLINTVFSSSYLKQHIEKVKTVIEAEMPFHFAKWGNDINAWNYEIENVVYPYIENRPVFALQFVGDTFKMKKQVDVELAAYPQKAGLVRINTIIPSDLPWKGKYFDGNKIIIKAIPNPGYRFIHWKAKDIVLENANVDSLIINVDTNTCFTAIYEQYLDENQLLIYPNPIKDFFNLEFIMEDDYKVIQYLYDIYGNVLKMSTYNAFKGLNVIKTSVAGLKSGVYYVKIDDSKKIKSAKIIVTN